MYVLHVTVLIFISVFKCNIDCNISILFLDAKILSLSTSSFGSLPKLSAIEAVETLSKWEGMGSTINLLQAVIDEDAGNKWSCIRRYVDDAFLKNTLISDLPFCGSNFSYYKLYYFCKISSLIFFPKNFVAYINFIVLGSPCYNTFNGTHLKMCF